MKAALSNAPQQAFFTQANIQKYLSDAPYLIKSRKTSREFFWARINLIRLESSVLGWKLSDSVVCGLTQADERLAQARLVI